MYYVVVYVWVDVRYCILRFPDPVRPPYGVYNNVINSTDGRVFFKTRMERYIFSEIVDRKILEPMNMFMKYIEKLQVSFS